MLPIDWKLVETKADELYPRYKGGLKYSQLEAELSAAGLDAMHITYVVEELERMKQAGARATINVPLAIASVLIAVGFMLGIAALLYTGNIAVAAGVALLMFVLARILLKKNNLRPSARKRWEEK